MQANIFSCLARKRTLIPLVQKQQHENSTMNCNTVFATSATTTSLCTLTHPPSSPVCSSSLRPVFSPSSPLSCPPPCPVRPTALSLTQMSAVKSHCATRDTLTQKPGCIHRDRQINRSRQRWRDEMEIRRCLCTMDLWICVCLCFGLAETLYFCISWVYLLLHNRLCV